MSVRITVKRNGPIVVRGEVELVDQEGNPIAVPPAKTPGTMSLCKCGRSASLPFCDGSHNKPVEG